MSGVSPRRPPSWLGPPGPARLLVGLALAFAVAVVLIELEAIEYAYQRIGILPRHAFALLLASLLGAHVNIPLARMRSRTALGPGEVVVFGLRYRLSPPVRPGETVLAVNLGGAVIPTVVSLYLCARTGVWIQASLATLIVAVFVHRLARPVPGLGIAMPPLLPPLLSALVAVLIGCDLAPAVAYVAGSMGTLVGADLMNLRWIPDLGAPVASIGGAGTFDGIFLTGIIAVLLA